MPISIPPSAALRQLKTVLKNAAADGELSEAGETKLIKDAFSDVLPTLNTSLQVKALYNKVVRATQPLSIGWTATERFESELRVVSSKREAALDSAAAIDAEFP